MVIRKTFSRLYDRDKLAVQSYPATDRLSRYLHSLNYHFYDKSILIEPFDTFLWGELNDDCVC